MITLRCTAALLKTLGRADDDAAPTGLLGDWDARVVVRRPRHLVLCTNERTLLCTVIPFARRHDLPQRFAQSAQRLIERIPASESLRAREVAALTDVRLGRATNRSVRSSMNQFGYAVQAWFETGRPADNLEGLSLWLCDTPCSPLKTHWPWLEAELVLTGTVAPGRRPFKFEGDVI